MTTDNVNHPPHYTQGKIEVIEILEDNQMLDFRLLNALKYILRCPYKGNMSEDLKKAKWYIDRVITELEREKNKL